MNSANRAFGTVSWKHHTLKSRLAMFSTLILPVLLYNCGLWTLSKTLTSKLDTWHRRKLRIVLGIFYPHRISNKQLYQQTKQRPLSEICRQRRLLWFGHIARQHPDSTSRKALEMAMNTSDIKKPRGRPLLRWIDIVRHDLKPFNISPLEAMSLACDKNAWLDIIKSSSSKAY